MEVESRSNGDRIEIESRERDELENQINRMGYTAGGCIGSAGIGMAGYGIVRDTGIMSATGIMHDTGITSTTDTASDTMVGTVTSAPSECGAECDQVREEPSAVIENQPWTAFEILTKRYHLNPGKAIADYLETKQEKIQEIGILKKSRGIHLLSYAYRFTRSRIQQPTYGTIVDFIVTAKLADEKGKRASVDFCLRCMMDLRMCEKRYYEPVVLLEGHFKDKFLNEYPIMTNDYLLPILHAKDYEIVAHDILNQYFPEIRNAIGQTGSTGQTGFIMDAEELAKRMGLDIYDVHFADEGIMGQIYYDFGEVNLLDKNGRAYQAAILPGTILVSIDNCRTEAIRNSTIVHECCHMYLDRWFFFLQMMTGKPYAAYTNRKKESRDYHKKMGYHKNSPLDWMELQCEKLPAYLLLEQEETKAFVDDRLKKDKSRDRYQHVISALAHRNKVSRSMAKYRMNELGYNSVEGISCYADNMRVPDHSCSGDWPEGVTFTISTLDLSVVCAESPNISEKLRCGEYVYVEGHICVNNRKYLWHDKRGQIYMTSYARSHIDECCLGFQVRGRYTNTDFSAGVVHRNATEPVTNKYLPSYTLASEPGSDAYDKENEIFAEDTFLWGRVSTELKTNMEINADFNRAVGYLMKIKGITVENMSGDMDVDRKTLYNARNNHRPKLGEVVAICVVLKLPYYISEELIEISRCRLLNTDEDMLYRAFLFSAEKLTIERCNDILAEHRFEPLIGKRKEA